MDTSGISCKVHEGRVTFIWFLFKLSDRGVANLVHFLLNYFPTHSNDNRCHPLQAWEPSLSALPQNGTCLSKHKYRKRRQSLCSAFVTEFAKANTQYGLQA